MKKIYKYELLPGKDIYKLPIDSKIIYFDSVGDKLFIWVQFIVENESFLQQRRFTVFPTGMKIPSHYQYIMSCRMWHLYEK
jgi:hypothetical protein